jgi:hypothetical protein
MRDRHGGGQGLARDRAGPVRPGCAGRMIIRVRGAVGTATVTPGPAAGPSGTLRYMISYMISEDNGIDYDIVGFEMSMIS